ncbi:MAG: co-chaperone GroES [Bdellovibrionales bacterium]|nr:co-chaperone GroES [Bdellovibrionales bacterium]
MAFAFQPLDDRILVERAGESNMTPGGLYIPDTVSERPTKGVVKAVGRGHQDKKGRVQPLDVKVGDTVLFTSYAGTEVEFGGETYLILRETDLLGVSAD